MKSHGTLRLALAFAALFGSLSLVVWRQSRALESLRELDAARAERALLESERTALARRIQELEGRARIVAVASARLGMHPAEANELVILQLPARETRSARRAPRLALNGGVRNPLELPVTAREAQ